MEDLREIAIIMQQMLEHQTLKLVASSATIHTMSVTLQEVQARERELEI